MARTFALLLAVCASCAAFHAPVSKAAAPQLRAAPGPAAVAAAAATTLVPQMASAEVGFTDEALGVFLGILPLALIARRRRGTSARAPSPDAAPPLAGRRRRRRRVLPFRRRHRAGDAAEAQPEHRVFAAEALRAEGLPLSGRAPAPPANARAADVIPPRRL